VTAREYMEAHGGTWPEDAPPGSPILERIAAAAEDPRFLDVLETCTACDAFAESGWTCNAEPGRCGGCSVRLVWARGENCPRGKWNPPESVPAQGVRDPEM